MTVEGESCAEGEEEREQAPDSRLTTSEPGRGVRDALRRSGRISMGKRVKSRL